jgi:hypothetical protein
LAAALVSGVLAVLTLRLIENPLRFAAPVRRSPGRSLALGGIATAVAVCVGLALLVVVPTPVGRGAPAAAPTLTTLPVAAGSTIPAYDAAVQHAFAQVQAAVAASADLQAVPSNLNPPLADAAGELNDLFRNGCMRNAWEVTQPDCATGDTASTTTVAVVGDSQAAMWNPAFHQVAEQRHWRLEMLTKAGCPLMDVPTTSAVLHREYTECERWRGQVIARLRAEHPRLVVIDMLRGYSTGNVYTESLTRLVQQLRGTGARVLMLGPTADPRSVVPICLSGHLDDATACSPPRSSAVSEPSIAAESAATKAGGGHYADLTELFCTSERCPVIVGNILVYSDKGHLTIEYSRLLAPAIGALADRALA